MAKTTPPGMIVTPSGAEIATTHTIGAKPYPMEEVRLMAQEAKRKYAARATHLPAATDVWCDANRREVHITMEGGCRVMIPLEEFHELKGATNDELRDVKLCVAGYLLEWPQLDMQYQLPEYIANLFGLPYLLQAEIKLRARSAGQAKSDAKTTAARANGAKGGRPKKSAAATP